MNKPSKKSCLVSALMILGFVIIFLLIVILSIKPMVPVNNLLITNPTFPTRWDSGEIPVQISIWTEAKPPYNASTYMINSHQETSKTWDGDGKYSVRITENVFLYNNALEALWIFLIVDPKYCELLTGQFLIMYVMIATLLIGNTKVLPPIKNMLFVPWEVQQVASFTTTGLVTANM